MRVIRNVVCALSITIGGANYAQASGIPTVDIAAVMQNMMEYIGQINEYAETALRYADQITNMEDQLNSVKGVADIAALAKKAQELKSQYDRMADNFDKLKSMAEDPLSLLDSDADLKKLFEKLQVYDNCADLSGVAKEACDYDFASKVKDIDDNTKNLKELNDNLKDITNLTQKLERAGTQKESTDALGEIQIAVYEHQIKQEQELAKRALAEAKRESDKVRNEQMQDEVIRKKAGFTDAELAELTKVTRSER
jgi:uncharacterized phage infection (PIP) family protein YhgE